MAGSLLRAAVAEAEEVRSWTCKTCDTLIEVEGQEHCRACAAYWSDVAQGIWDDPEDDFHPDEAGL